MFYTMLVTVPVFRMMRAIVPAIALVTVLVFVIVLAIAHVIVRVYPVVSDNQM